MDFTVPFVSSGALNAAHYKLVRNVETAPDPEIADSFLHHEINTIRSQLRHPAISLKQVKECLLVLLYCSVSVASNTLPNTSLEFALRDALNLAEAGQRASDKRIG
ncbi:Adaptin-N domain-containing protein [Mycena kentingensis (nom. inval.)]|nr:Adaptin-N domain-containing protein [Mycena kentingensis (nom. inval.)]